MNTQTTPETDVWEAYCDECYYHMWRLRRKTERGWYDGFHIHTGEEARGLCETLNKLERERDEARAESIRWMSIAEGRGRTDDDTSVCQELNDANERMGKKLAQTLDERDRLAEKIDKLESHIATVKKCHDWTMADRDAVARKRDRLAEALRYCREDSAELLGERDWWQDEPRCDYAKRWQETHDNLTRADEALQSLTPNAKP